MSNEPQCDQEPELVQLISRLDKAVQLSLELSALTSERLDRLIQKPPTKSPPESLPSLSTCFAHDLGRLVALLEQGNRLCSETLSRLREAI